MLAATSRRAVVRQPWSSSSSSEMSEIAERRRDISPTPRVLRLIDWMTDESCSSGGASGTTAACSSSPSTPTRSATSSVTCEAAAPRQRAAEHRTSSTAAWRRSPRGGQGGLQRRPGGAPAAHPHRHRRRPRGRQPPEPLRRPLPLRRAVEPGPHGAAQRPHRPQAPARRRGPLPLLRLHPAPRGPRAPGAGREDRRRSSRSSAASRRWSTSKLAKRLAGGIRRAADRRAQPRHRERGPPATSGRVVEEELEAAAKRPRSSGSSSRSSRACSRCHEIIWVTPRRRLPRWPSMSPCRSSARLPFARRALGPTASEMWSFPALLDVRARRTRLARTPRHAAKAPQARGEAVGLAARATSHGRRLRRRRRARRRHGAPPPGAKARAAPAGALPVAGLRPRRSLPGLRALVAAVGGEGRARRPAVAPRSRRGPVARRAHPRHGPVGGGREAGRGAQAVPGHGRGHDAPGARWPALPGARSLARQGRPRSPSRHAGRRRRFARAGAQGPGRRGREERAYSPLRPRRARGEGAAAAPRGAAEADP